MDIPIEASADDQRTYHLCDTNYLSARFVVVLYCAIPLYLYIGKAGDIFAKPWCRQSILCFLTFNFWVIIYAMLNDGKEGEDQRKDWYSVWGTRWKKGTELRDGDW